MVDDFHMHLHKGNDSLQVILNKKVSITSYL